MSTNRLRVVVVAGWFAALIAMLGAGVALGVPATLTQTVEVFLVGCIPAMVLLKVFRGAPPPTVAQVLYDADHTGADRSGDAMANRPPGRS